MKKNKMLFMVLFIVLFLVGCSNYHKHNYVEGVCECGERDPNYTPPHEHNYVEGVCECGERDSNYTPPHEHNYVEGVCECGEYKIINIDESFLEGKTSVGYHKYLHDSVIHSKSIEKVRDLFIEYFIDIEITCDKERVDYVNENISHSENLSMTFHGENYFSIFVFEDGTILLKIDGITYASVENSVVDEQSIYNYLYGYN